MSTLIRLGTKHFESYSAMQKKALQILEGVSSITCDRCGRASQAEAIGISEFTSIDFVGGYGSIFGDGSKVEVDLCQQCLQATLGHWLRVSESDRRESALARALEAFDPARHGGEAFSREDGASNAVLPNRPASNLVGFRPPAEPGAMSVDIPTDREQSLCTDRDPEQVFGLIERADETGALVRRMVAVGTRIAPRPPHRSARAELPHTAPALSHDAKRSLGYG